MITRAIIKKLRGIGKENCTHKKEVSHSPSQDFDPDLINKVIADSEQNTTLSSEISEQPIDIMDIPNNADESPAIDFSYLIK